MRPLLPRRILKIRTGELHLLFSGMLIARDGGTAGYTNGISLGKDFLKGIIQMENLGPLYT